MAEARLRAAHGQVQQRANEGQFLPRSFGQTRAGARQPGSLSEARPEPAFLLTQGKLEAWMHRSEPRCFSAGSGVGGNLELITGWYPKTASQSEQQTE